MKDYYLDLYANARLLLNVHLEADNDAEAYQKIKEHDFDIVSEEICDMVIDTDHVEYTYDDPDCDTLFYERKSDEVQN